MVPSSYADFVVSMRAPPSDKSKYQDYFVELVTLALEKTRPEYGDYRLEILPQWSSVHERALSAASQDLYPNLIVEVSYDAKLIASGRLTYIDFPVVGGIVGYRVCFVRSDIKESVKNAKTLDELRQFTFGQGTGWADNEILRFNGFKVVEVVNYENIFKMILAGRVDLFCRGANQLQLEYEEFKDLGNLEYDESFALVYPLPRFFYLNSKNTLAKERIATGLKRLYHDGSFKALWIKHYKSTIEFSNLKKRKLYRLENPLLKDLPPDYQQYFIDPMTL